MKEFYITEGHVFYDDDSTSYFKWKVKDLINTGFTIEEIIEFDESEEWHFYVKKMLIENDG